MRTCIDKQAYLEKYGIENIKSVLQSAGLSAIIIIIVKLVLTGSLEDQFMTQVLLAAGCLFLGQYLSGEFGHLRIASNVAIGAFLLIMTEQDVNEQKRELAHDSHITFKIKEYVLLWLVLNI